MPQEENARPDPDTLLHEATQETKGKLKIFLGAAPGVGKTYAMLLAGKRLLADGVDVVVGVVETHGRRETQSLLVDLPTIPLKTITYRERSFQEMDLDALIQRHPQVALVDELAHDNPPGCTHSKRYQDVEVLLDAGIDVLTTLNVQHLESLNDVVARISRIRVRNTVPDRIVERAHEIELIDLPPDDLLQRLREGKVYVPEHAERAREHFFRLGNLTALREMAFRVAADRAEAAMVRYMKGHGIRGPWPAGSRIMLYLNTVVGSERLVRATKRLAERQQSPWTAFFVESPRRPFPESQRQQLAEALRLAERLGAETVVLSSNDPIQETLDYARNHNVTQIVLGRPAKSSWLAWRWGETEQLMRKADGFEVLLVTWNQPSQSSAAAAPVWLRWREAGREAPRQVVIGTLLTACATAVALVLWRVLPQTNVALLYLAAVTLAAIHLGLRAALTVLVLAAFTMDFLFLEPRFSLIVSQPSDQVGLAFFCVMSLVATWFAWRLRDHMLAIEHIARRNTSLHELSRKLAGALWETDVADALAEHVRITLGVQSILLLGDERGALKPVHPADGLLDNTDLAAADWVWRKGKAAGFSSDTLPSSAWLFLPLVTAHGRLGVAGFALRQSKVVLRPDEMRLLDSLAHQTAVAIERVQLVAQAQNTRVLIEAERLRTALLGSISADLRSPLSAIIAAATTMASTSEASTESKRALMEVILDEAERLNRFVQNLIDMTRLGRGALEPNLRPCAVADLVGRAVKVLDRLLANHAITIDVDGDLPQVMADANLMEQAFANLLDHASRQAAARSNITLSGSFQPPRTVKVVVTYRNKPQDQLLPPGRDDNAEQLDAFGMSLSSSLFQAQGCTLEIAAPKNKHETRLIITIPIADEPTASTLPTGSAHF